jgi:hypothetical protein
MTTTAAITVFRALNTSHSGTLSAAEVTPTWACAPGAAVAPVADLVGLNQDQFVASLAKKAVPATLIEQTSQEIHYGLADPDHSFGNRVANFFGGLGLMLLGVVLAPVEIGMTIAIAAQGGQAGFAWGPFIIGADLLADSVKHRTPQNPSEVTNATTMFLEAPSVAGSQACPTKS